MPSHPSVNSGTLLANPVIITLSATHAKSSQLAVGKYRVIADVDAWFLQGPTGVASSTTSSNFIPAKTFFPDYLIVTDASNAFVDAIAGGAGKMYLERVEEALPNNLYDGSHLPS